MEKQTNWLRILTETIGIQTIIAIILGVPTMIAIVSIIWNSLSLDKRIIVVILLCIFIAMVILFVYAQMKKALNVLPKLLLRMHLVAKSHINSINLDTMNQSDLWNFLNLVGVDKDFKTITTPEEVPSKVEMIYSKMKTNPLSDDDAEEIVNYFLSKSKIEKILENDRAYKKIIKEIDGMSSLIPSEDIALKVNEFKKDSDRAYYLYIVNQMPPDLMSKIFSPKIEAKFITINKNIDGEIMKSLARVRESIDRYYRRDKLNDTAKS